MTVKLLSYAAHSRYEGHWVTFASQNYFSSFLFFSLVSAPNIQLIMASLVFSV